VVFLALMPAVFLTKIQVGTMLSY